MDMEKANSDKKPYNPPVLRTYGDLRRLTAGASGPQRDGGSGATKSKASGSSF